MADKKIIRMTKDEWMELGTKLYGSDFMKWKFVCPCCGHVQTVEDFKQYKDKGATPDTARFNCIGRYDGHMDSPMGTKPGPCNYTSGGLFRLAPIEITDGDKKYSSFAFADA